MKVSLCAQWHLELVPYTKTGVKKGFRLVFCLSPLPPPSLCQNEMSVFLGCRTEKFISVLSKIRPHCP